MNKKTVLLSVTMAAACLLLASCSQNSTSTAPSSQQSSQQTNTKALADEAEKKAKAELEAKEKFEKEKKAYEEKARKDLEQIYNMPRGTQAFTEWYEKMREIFQLTTGDDRDPSTFETILVPMREVFLERQAQYDANPNQSVYSIDNPYMVKNFPFSYRLLEIKSIEWYESNVLTYEATATPYRYKANIVVGSDIGELTAEETAQEVEVIIWYKDGKIVIFSDGMMIKEDGLALPANVDKIVEKVKAARGR